MEKLLLLTQKQGGKYAGNLSRQRTKNSSFSCEGLQNHFLPTHGGNLFTQPYLGRCILVN